MQVLVSALPNLQKLQKENGSEGKKEITKLTRFICLAFAIIQSTTVALFLKPILFDWTYTLGIEIIISLTTGAMVVLWLSEIITETGIGNGPSLLIFINTSINCYKNNYTHYSF